MTATVSWYETETERRVARDYDRLRARLLGLLDTMGLPPGQVAAAKQLVKDLSYESQRALITTLREEEP